VTGRFDRATWSGSTRQAGADKWARPDRWARLTGGVERFLTNFKK
jgi:hypothetical protein